MISSTGTGAGADADEVTLTKSGTTLSVKTGGVAAAQIATDGVESAEIKDSNVTSAKLSVLTKRCILLGIYPR